MDPPRINPPVLFTRAHRRIPSLSPNRSPTRQRITEDILSDLSPATTLEAFTSPSGKFRASVEAATPSERSFGIRATIASKKIQEWVGELSAWPWPLENGSAGFEVPTAKRRRISADERMPRAGHTDTETSDEEYIGSLPAEDVARYENRVDDIQEDMDDLNVEEIKSTVLNTHFSPRSRPSSSSSNTTPSPGLVASYTRMDDFTAVVTATVLQALPNLSKLMRLMDVWTVRLLVLRKVPPLIRALDEVEVALKSGWQAVEAPHSKLTNSQEDEDDVLDRKTFEIMRDVLQYKVTTLGQELDYMLDTLEGRQDTLPEMWLDRMETIETDYGEWVVRGDRKVREGEWAKMAKARKAEVDRLRAEEEAKEVARLQAENERKAREEKLRLEQEEASKLERQRQEAEEKLRLEQVAALEEARNAKLAQKQEEDRIRAAEEAAKQEAERQKIEHEVRMRLKQEAAAEAARKRELDRIETEEEAARREAERQRLETEERLRLENEAAMENARQAELARKEEEHALMLENQRIAEAEAAEPLEREAFREKQAQLAITKEKLKSDELPQQQTTMDSEENKAKNTGEQIPFTIRHPSQEVEAELTPPSTASGLALGIGLAITTNYFRSDNGEVADLENRDAQRETSYHRSPMNTHYVDLVTSAETDSPFTPTSKLARLDGSDETEFKSADIATDCTSLIMDTNLKDHEKFSPSFNASSPPKSPNSKSRKTSTIATSSESPSAAPSPSIPSGSLTPLALALSSTKSIDDLSERFENFDNPETSSNIRHGLLNGTSSLIDPNDIPQALGSQPRPPPPTVSATLTQSPRTPTKATAELISPPTQTLMTGSPTLSVRSQARKRKDQEWVIAEPAEEAYDRGSETVVGSAISSEINDISGPRKDRGDISLVPGYSTLDPTPVLLEAKPSESFRPVLSPTRSPRSPVETAEQILPSKAPLKDVSLGPYDTETPSRYPGFHRMQPLLSRSPRSPPNSRLGSEIGSDGAQESVPRSSEEFEFDSFAPAVLARKTSIARINSPIRRIEIQRRSSTASDASTIINRQPGDIPPSPVNPSSPLSEIGDPSRFPDFDEDSPSKGRAISRIQESVERSPSRSPPPIPAISPRRSFRFPRSPTPPSSRTESKNKDISSTPTEAPVFDTVNLSQASILPSPKKTTDDLIQAQISSLLESIPARIRLTSEPEPASFPPANTLRPAKTHRAATPSLRSHSSLSSRAPTPSFTLAPAHGKATSRPRPQNGNPEIKLYHLSRSTGEAPIKLFVRLVGENGERVMVRVGGGWADLGEYLREYASHHGRRSGVDSDKVEVQDIRPRVVSTSSTTSSSATMRGNGRSSPVSRPGSAFDRPMSSLHIRKTRRSIGETDSSTITFKSPSTPRLPLPTRSRELETPPSEKSRSSSRLSWAEEEGGLGLAGPKAKKVVISEKDQEWVESMKEKVRLASAEKDRKEKSAEGARKSFGEMEKIGGTKRLFRKG